LNTGYVALKVIAGSVEMLLRLAERLADLARGLRLPLH
jgi:hypothetical protein